jgi:iron complex transport system ATP-binding protein
MIEAHNLSYKVADKELLRNFSYKFEAGRHYMICGPNGAGKSTLMKLLALDWKPASGDVKYNGVSTDFKRREQYATSRAVLSQQIELAFPLQVEEVVLMGRYPYFTARPAKHDLEIVQECMRLLDVLHLRQRNFLTLSGGEKQRVHFARVLAQIWEPPADGNRLLLLDEPVSFLDLRHQVDLLLQVKRILDDRTVVILIMHDLNLVLNFADEVLMLSKGELYANGKPSEVLTENNIEKVFDQRVSIQYTDRSSWIWPVVD